MPEPIFRSATVAMAEDGRIVKQDEDYTAHVDAALPVAVALASVCHVYAIGDFACPAQNRCGVTLRSDGFDGSDSLIIIVMMICLAPN